MKTENVDWLLASWTDVRRFEQRWREVTSRSTGEVPGEVLKVLGCKLANHSGWFNVVRSGCQGREELTEFERRVLVLGIKSWGPRADRLELAEALFGSRLSGGDMLDFAEDIFLREGVSVEERDQFLGVFCVQIFKQNDQHLLQKASKFLRSLSEVYFDWDSVLAHLQISMGPHPSPLSHHSATPFLESLAQMKANQEAWGPSFLKAHKESYYQLKMTSVVAKAIEILRKISDFRCLYSKRFQIAGLPFQSELWPVFLTRLFELAPPLFLNDLVLFGAKHISQSAALMDLLEKTAATHEVFGAHFTSILTYYGLGDTFWGHHQLFLQHICRQSLKIRSYGREQVAECGLWLHLLDYFRKHLPKKLKIEGKNFDEEEIFDRIRQCLLCGGSAAEELVVFCWERLVAGGSGKVEPWLGYLSYLQFSGKPLPSILKLIKRCLLFFKGNKKPVIEFYRSLKQSVLQFFDPKSAEANEIQDQISKIEKELSKFDQPDSQELPVVVDPAPALPTPLPHPTVHPDPSPAEPPTPPKPTNVPAKIVTVHLRDLPATTDYVDIEALVS